MPPLPPPSAPTRRHPVRLVLWWAWCAPRRAVSAGVLCLALITALAGCGSSDNGVASKSASQILAATTAAAQSSNSVRVSTRSTVGGGTAKLTMSASLAKDHGHARLALAGIGVEAIRAGETLYIKGNDRFDAQLERTFGVKVPARTWLKGPASGTLGRIGSFIDMSRELPLILSVSGPVTKGATTTVDGQPAIELKEVAKLYTGTLYVATTGTPYPIKLVKTGRETGKTVFSGWNDPVTVTPPKNAVDFSQLQHLKGH
jgi:hypothetical protein